MESENSILRTQKFPTTKKLSKNIIDCYSIHSLKNLIASSIKKKLLFPLIKI